MAYVENYAVDAPARAEIDALPGLALLEFGTNWCGHCQAAQAGIATALSALPDLRYIKVEDGPGRPLGRSYRVKLWPTLIFLKDGQEIERLVRPRAAEEVAIVLRRLAGA